MSEELKFKRLSEVPEFEGIIPDDAQHLVVVDGEVYRCGLSKSGPTRQLVAELTSSNATAITSSWEQGQMAKFFEGVNIEPGRNYEVEVDLYDDDEDCEVEGTVYLGRPQEVGKTFRIKLDSTGGYETFRDGNDRPVMVPWMLFYSSIDCTCGMGDTYMPTVRVFFGYDAISGVNRAGFTLYLYDCNDNRQTRAVRLYKIVGE